MLPVLEVVLNTVIDFVFAIVIIVGVGTEALATGSVVVDILTYSP